MKAFGKFLGIVSVVVILPALLVAVLVSLVFFFRLIPLTLLSLVYGWMLYTFLLYRHGRQEEFLHLLTTAAGAEAPLAPALRAYLRDRPRGGWRRFWVAGLLFFVVPGYYWFWHRRHSFHRKVADVARQLEEGVSLHDALRATPGVASRETVLAVAIGQPTGKLAQCLSRSSQGRLATVWIELLPRPLYPLLLVLILSAVIGFWAVFLAPRFQRIFHDFDIGLPWLTVQLIHLGEHPVEYGVGLYLALMVLVALGTLALILLLATALLLGAFKIERASAAVDRRLTAQHQLADQFRQDVAQAVAAPKSLEKRRAGSTCLILRMADDSYVIYRWDDGRLERSVLDAAGDSSRPMPVGSDRVRVEFARTGSKGTLISMRLIESRDGVDGKHPVVVMAALGGDLR
jgi:hypothetical protein